MKHDEESLLDIMAWTGCKT